MCSSDLVDFEHAAGWLGARAHVYVLANHGAKPNVALGTGDTPIKQCLTMIRDNKWPIYGIIEREFRGPDTPVNETKGQMDYLKKLLES